VAEQKTVIAELGVMAKWFFAIVAKAWDHQRE